MELMTAARDDPLSRIRASRQEPAQGRLARYDLPSLPRSTINSAPSPNRCRRHLHLPDASPNTPGWARELPHMRNDAGAGQSDGRGGRKPRTDEHDAAILGRVRSHLAGVRSRNGRPHPRPWNARSRIAASLDMDSVRAVHAGRPVGGMAVFPTRLGVDRPPQPQHVQPDRPGHGLGLPLQSLCDLCARPVPGWVSRNGRYGPCLFRSRGGDHRSCVCWARCSNCAPASRPAARSAPC